jgi:hypothetical protein
MTLVVADCQGNPAGMPATVLLLLLLVWGVTITLSLLSISPDSHHAQVVVVMAANDGLSNCPAILQSTKPACCSVLHPFLPHCSHLTVTMLKP